MLSFLLSGWGWVGGVGGGRLLPLAVAGLVTALTVYISGNEEHPITLVFAPMVVFWGIGESTTAVYTILILHHAGPECKGRLHISGSTRRSLYLRLE